MSRYCENCQLVYDGDRCPACGSKKGREPRETDSCFLCEKQILWGEVLEDALKQNGIPVVFRKRLGIGLALKVGPMMEWVKVYVPYARLEESRAIVETLFESGDADADETGETDESDKESEA